MGIIMYFLVAMLIGGIISAASHEDTVNISNMRDISLLYVGIIIASALWPITIAVVVGAVLSEILD